MIYAPANKRGLGSGDCKIWARGPCGCKCRQLTVCTRDLIPNARGLSLKPVIIFLIREVEMKQSEPRKARDGEPRVEGERYVTTTNVNGSQIKL